MRLLLFAITACAMAAPISAQEAGWHYSPYPREGDRAAMGCATGSTPEQHACLVVRCEDDLSVAVYVKTSRSEGDVGQWVVQIDDAAPVLDTIAVASGVPYGGKVVETETPVATLIEMLKQSFVVYLQPLGGDAPMPNGVPGKGSLYAINQALYFCAPRNPPGSADDGAEKGADAGGDG